MRAAVGEELPDQIAPSDAHASQYASSPMDAQQALADLTEISSQIQAAVVFDDSGSIAASTSPDEARARALADGAARLLAEGDGLASSVPNAEGVRPLVDAEAVRLVQGFRAQLERADRGRRAV